jgi:phosphatidylinositol glycan class S
MQLSFVSLAQHVSNLAYFDPTLLPLLYFPQEHKYAVYTPLFGPVSVPLVMGLVREFKEWRDRRRKRRLAEKENDASSLREKTE